MDENLQNIEDLFRASLLDNAESPSKNVWESVEKRLNEANFVQLQNKYNRLRVISALLLLLLIISLYEIKNNDNDKSNFNNRPGFATKAKVIEKNRGNLP